MPSALSSGLVCALLSPQNRAQRECLLNECKQARSDGKPLRRGSTLSDGIKRLAREQRQPFSSPAPKTVPCTHRATMRSQHPLKTFQSAFLLGWPWEAQSSPRVASESWGLRSSHCRGQQTSPRCDPTDGSPPGSLVPGILQARTLEWVAPSCDPQKSPDTPGSPEGNTEGPGTASSEPLLPS